MKIYGIIRTVWNGNSYSSNPDEDIFLYLSKEERDKNMPSTYNKDAEFAYDERDCIVRK